MTFFQDFRPAINCYEFITVATAVTVTVTVNPFFVGFDLFEEVFPSWVIGLFLVLDLSMKFYWPLSQSFYYFDKFLFLEAKYPPFKIYWKRFQFVKNDLYVSIYLI